jgi:hypothetical protein
MRRVGDGVPSRPRGVELGMGVNEASGGKLGGFGSAAKAEGPERWGGEGEGRQLLGLQRHLRRVAKDQERTHKGLLLEFGTGSKNCYNGTRRPRRHPDDNSGTRGEQAAGAAGDEEGGRGRRRDEEDHQSWKMRWLRSVEGLGRVRALVPGRSHRRRGGGGGRRASCARARLGGLRRRIGFRGRG